MSSGTESANWQSLSFSGPLAQRHRARLVVGGTQLVVLAHGLGTDQTSWDEVVTALRSRFSLLLFDLPGAGPLLPDGFDPGDYNSLARFADDLLNLLDEIGVARCAYVGHSVSGMIGVLAAIEKPSMFEQLILLNASPRYLNDDNYVGGFERSDLDALFDFMGANYQAWVAGFAPAVVGPDRPAAVDEFSAGLLAMRPDVTLKITRTIFESDVRSLLSQLRIPTTLIHSHADMAVPSEVAHFLQQHISGSRLEWIDARGHLPHLSSPAVVSEALSKSLAS